MRFKICLAKKEDSAQYGRESSRFEAALGQGFYGAAEKMVE
jgi:hypothetical protein